MLEASKEKAATRAAEHRDFDSPVLFCLKRGSEYTFEPTRIFSFRRAPKGSRFFSKQARRRYLNTLSGFNIKGVYGEYTLRLIFYSITA